MKSLFLLQMKRQEIPVQDLGLQSVNSSQELYKGHEAHFIPLSKICIKLFLNLDKFSYLANSYSQTKEGWQKVTETGFNSEPEEMPAGTHSDIYTPGSVFQQPGHDSIPAPRQFVSDKGLGSLSFYMQRSDEAFGSDKFCQDSP